MIDLLSWLGNVFGYLVVLGIGVVIGMMSARNLNRADRAYWMAQGAHLQRMKEKHDDTE